MRARGTVLIAAGLLAGAAAAGAGGALATQAGGSPVPVRPGGDAGLAATTTSGTPATVTIADVGDTMMGSPPWGLPPSGGRYLFSAVRADLSGNVVTGNLEGTLTGYTGTSKCARPSSTCFAFRSPPGYAANLKRAGFTVMNGANNHSHDFGAAGQANTAAALRRVGMRYTGPPGTIAIQHVGAVSVAILGFAPYNWANSSLNLAGVAALVRKAAREADLVIVHVHAGAEGVGAQHVRPGTEYYLGENRGNVVAFAHTAIDAGADLILGSGPHVLRGMQFWHGHLIAYSMGNFVGYKAFGLGGVLSQSAVLQVTLNAAGGFVAGRLRPVRLNTLGVPSPGGYGIADIRALSREDFGTTAARISTAGVVTPPQGRYRGPATRSDGKELGMERINVGDVRLAIREQGRGDPVVLLHGFPELSYSWRHQLPALAAAGYRAIAPDLRGYGASDRPTAVDAYAVPALVGDVVGLIDALGYPHVHLVGHDWGGGLAWATAALHPRRVRSLTIANAPHPVASAEARREDPSQRAKSWYMLLFLFAGVAESWLANDDFLHLREMVFDDAAPGTFTPEDVQVYLDAFAPDGALTAALNYYRANMPAAAWLREPPQLPAITVPTMVVWGEADTYLGLGLLERSVAKVDGPVRVERLPGVSHWVQQEAPAAVNALLIDWLRAAA